MTRIILITLLSFLPFMAFSIDIDTITPNIIVLNEGYDRVSAIKTSEGIVVIDTHKSTMDMSRMKKKIIEYFNDSTFAYVINSHPCLEHINGNSLFPNSLKVAHANFARQSYPDSSDNRIAFINKRIPELTDKINQSSNTIEIKELKSQLEYFISMRNDFFKAAIPPDITFTDKMKLRVGDKTFEMTYVGDGAHGNSSILIYVAEEKTLFTGSAFSMPPIVYKTGGWIQKQNVERWISVLEEYMENPELENIVASHVKYYTKDDLKEMRDYYFLISNTIKENKAKGISREETFKTLAYEIIQENFNVFTTNEKDKERHESNIEILWDYFE